MPSRSTGLLFALPALIVLALLIAYPVAYTGLLSVTDEKGAFVGLKNFAGGAEARGRRRRPSGTPSGGSAARSSSRCCSARRRRSCSTRASAAAAALRAITLIPWVVPGIVAATTWAWMFHTEFGIINYMLTAPGHHRRAGRLADQPRHRHAGDDRDQRLEALPLRRDHGARRPAVDPARTSTRRPASTARASGTRCATSCCPAVRPVIVAVTLLLRDLGAQLHHHHLRHHPRRPGEPDADHADPDLPPRLRERSSSTRRRRSR